MKINPKRAIVPLIVAVFSFAVVTALKFSSDDKGANKSAPAAVIAADSSKQEPEPPPKPLPLEESHPHMIGRNNTLYEYLRSKEVPSLDIIEMVNAAKPTRNLSMMGPRTRFHFEQGENKELKMIEFWFSPIERLKVQKNPEQGWQAELIQEKVDIQAVSFVGEVQTTLWESALKAQMDPMLIAELAEIFGWEVDFAREVQVGDRWRITVEQKLVRGVPMGWGSILVAEYENVGRSYKALLFRLDGKNLGYFNPEGESLRKMFLKSPLKFARVTSRFNRRRFHPKLKVVRPHNGVDYGAPIGTPVRSVANGTVIMAQYSGGGGNVLKIRHNSTYQTAYKHLNGFAKGVRRGAKVRQGQIVAYTGNTGLSTGPHLHYEFYVNGRYVDPLRQKFPSADPVPAEHMQAFKLQSKALIASLPHWDGQPQLAAEPVKSWTQDFMPPVIHQDRSYTGPTVVGQ